MQYKIHGCRPTYLASSSLRTPSVWRGPLCGAVFALRGPLLVPCPPLSSLSSLSAGPSPSLLGGVRAEPLLTAHRLIAVHVIRSSSSSLTSAFAFSLRSLAGEAKPSSLGADATSGISSFGNNTVRCTGSLSLGDDASRRISSLADNATRGTASWPVGDDALRWPASLATRFIGSLSFFEVVSRLDISLGDDAARRDTSRWIASFGGASSPLRGVSSSLNGPSSVSAPDTRLGWRLNTNWTVSLTGMSTRGNTCWPGDSPPPEHNTL